MVSRDGNDIVTAGYDGTARIWNTSSLQQIGVLTEPHNNDVNSAAFSPDGKEIVTGSTDGTARIWSVSTQEQLTVITDPGNAPLESAELTP